MYMKSFTSLRDAFTIDAHAHCDIPCGIYDPTAAKVAAKTVARMVDQITELALPNDPSDPHAVLEFSNAINRRIVVKDQHAQICKQELLILWTDFFKEEHLSRFPDLHETFWKAAKLCSDNKHHIDKDTAKELVDAVDGIAQKFYEIKGDPDRFGAFKDVTDKLY